jgi:hypothetical protein
LGTDFEIIILVSSAKRTGLVRPAIVFGKSFIYNIKNKGPRKKVVVIRNYIRTLCLGTR